MCAGVCRCMRMDENVLRIVQMCSAVCRCVRMFADVWKLTLGTVGLVGWSKRGKMELAQKTAQDRALLQIPQGLGHVC